MQNPKLTIAIQHRIAAAIVANRYREEYLTLATNEANLAHLAYNEVYPADLRRIMDSLPSWILNWTESFKVKLGDASWSTGTVSMRFDGAHHIWPASNSDVRTRGLSLGSNMPADAIRRRTGAAEGTKRAIAHARQNTAEVVSSDLIDLYREHRKAQIELQKNVNQAFDEVMRVLRQSTTFDALQKAWPDAEPIILRFRPKPTPPVPRDPTPRPLLPAIDYADLSRRYGLPPDVVPAHA